MRPGIALADLVRAINSAGCRGNANNQRDKWTLELTSKKWALELVLRIL
jgi:hypothetical protein